MNADTYGSLAGKETSVLRGREQSDDYPKRAQIRECMDGLEKMLVTASDSFAMLEERLGAVLSHGHESEANPCDPVAPLTCPLANELDARIDAVRFLNNRINRLLQRVEL